MRWCWCWCCSFSSCATEFFQLFNVFRQFRLTSRRFSAVAFTQYLIFCIATARAGFAQSQLIACCLRAALVSSLSCDSATASAPCVGIHTAAIHLRQTATVLFEVVAGCHPLPLGFRLANASGLFSARRLQHRPSLDAVDIATDKGIRVLAHQGSEHLVIRHPLLRSHLPGDASCGAAALHTRTFASMGRRCWRHCVRRRFGAGRRHGLYLRLRHYRLGFDAGSFAFYRQCGRCNFGRLHQACRRINQHGVAARSATTLYIVRLNQQVQEWVIDGLDAIDAQIAATIGTFL